MKTSIKHIANIQTGVFIKTVDKGDLVYLQSKHFDENGRLNTVLHPDIKSDNVTRKHILMTGDVLFAAKGTKNFAAVFEEHNLPAVASTSFFVLKVSTNEILPAFLAWFLNHPNTQAWLKSKARGTSIPSLRKDTLDLLEISIPPVEKQKLILEISRLSNTETEIRNRITEMKKHLIQQRIINTINNNV